MSVGGWVGECVCAFNVFLPILLTPSYITHLFRYKYYLSGQYVAVPI